MGAFGGLFLTKKGQALLTKAQTGKQLKYSRVGIGDGNLNGVDPTTLNKLVLEVKSTPITKLTIQQDKAVIGFVLSNKDLVTGFYFREIGIFALDPDEGEILYCYANAGTNAEFIPPAGSAETIEKEINALVTVGNAQKVTAVIDETIVLATKEDVSHALNTAISYVDSISVIEKHKDITLQPGIRLVDAPDTAPFSMGETRGWTLINLLGSSGGEKRDLETTETTTTVSFSFDPFSITGGKAYLVIGSLYNRDSAYIKMEAIMGAATKEIGSFADRSTTKVIYKGFVCESNATSMTIKVTIAKPSGSKNNSGGSFSSVRVYEIPASDLVKVNDMPIGELEANYPYVDSMTNVTNPYAIATSGNLLPPFTEWEQGVAVGDNCIISELYAVTIDAQKVGGSFVRYYVPVLKSTSYTFSVESLGTNSLAYMYLCKSDKTRIDNVKLKGTVTTTEETDWLEVVLNTLDSSGTTPVVGTAKYHSPMLVPDDKPQPFAPQSRTMWAAECQLAANPVDGNNADVLYVGDDGLPYVLKNWDKVALDGSLGWKADKDFDGFKRTRIPDFTGANNATYSQYLTKYDGSVLLKDGRVDAVDTFELQPGTGYLYLTISNKDSGWGDKYTPTADEIKAYFLGWRMYDKTLGATSVYNRTDGLNKSWAYRDPLGADGLAGGTETLPTTQAPITSMWQPYHLQYLKSKPTVEPVRNYETGLTLGKGWNMVEVGSGVVIREKANPYPNGDGTYSINTLSNPTKYRVDSISSVYRNNVRDVTYSLERRKPDSEYIGTLGYGFAKTSSFDSTAVYHVTYTMLDPTLSALINGSISTNLRGTVTDVVQWASDTERRLSVVETHKAEKDAPQWIAPSLINGWENVGRLPLMYKKVNNLVFIRGRVDKGTIGIGKGAVFILPNGYRPKEDTYLTVNDFTANSRYVCIKPTGRVEIEGGESKAISFDGVIFEAEQ